MTSAPTMPVSSVPIYACCSYQTRFGRLLTELDAPFIVDGREAEGGRFATSSENASS